MSLCSTKRDGRGAQRELYAGASSEEEAWFFSQVCQWVSTAGMLAEQAAGLWAAAFPRAAPLPAEVALALEERSVTPARLSELLFALRDREHQEAGRPGGGAARRRRPAEAASPCQRSRTHPEGNVTMVVRQAVTPVARAV